MEWTVTRPVDWRADVVAAQGGDKAAFDRLVRQFKHMAAGYAYSVLRDFHLAEDAAQEAFIQAYFNLETLREPGAFPAWFRRVVYKHCDRLTRRRRVMTVSPEDAEAADAVAAASTSRAAAGGDPADAAVDRETQETVLAGLNSLTPRQREAATLFYINGYSLAEVGEFLDVPVSTVKNRVYSARRKLKERMIGQVKETLHGRAPGDDFGRRIRRVLDGVPKVSFYSGGDVCPEDITFPSSMAAVMRYLGEDYPWLPLESHDKTWKLNYGNILFMGVSGIAFGLLWKPGWHEDNQDMMRIAGDPEDVIGPSFGAAGYGYRYITKHGRAGARATEAGFRSEIIASIDRGVPVLAFGVLGPPECCVVTGYDEDGDVLLGWNFFQSLPEFGGGGPTEPSGYFRRRDWFPATESLIVIGPRTRKPPLRDVYRRSLEWGLRVLRTPEAGGRASGIAAWQAWADQVCKDEELDPAELDLLKQRHFIHWAMVSNTAECRAWGGSYLDQVAEDLPEIGGDLGVAAEDFHNIHDLMWDIWALEGGWRNPDAHLVFARPEVRRKVAGVLLQAKAKDEEAASAIERALSKLEAKP